MPTKPRQPKLQNTAKFKSMRLTSEVVSRVEKILKVVNSKPRGRKVKGPELINLALTLIDETHIKGLQKSSLCFEDQKEVWRSIYIKQNGHISKDDFTGFTMTKDWIAFMEENKGTFEKSI